MENHNNNKNQPPAAQNVEEEEEVAVNEGGGGEGDMVVVESGMEQMDFSDEEDDGDYGEIEDIELDNSVQTIESHQGQEVYSCNFHPTDSSIATSGGMDDKAYVWNVETGDTLLECAGHKDSVTYSDFNADGSLLATCDMKGFIQVWGWPSKELIWSNEETFDENGNLEWAKWHHKKNALFAGFDQGLVWMWMVPSKKNKEAVSKFFASTGSSCTAGAIRGKYAMFGYIDGSMKVFDLNNQQIVHSFTKGIDCHKSQVNDLNFAQEGFNVATAGMDGWSKIVNAENGKMVASYKVDVLPVQVSDEDREDHVVECARINSRFNLLAMGSSDRSLYVWNLATKNIVKRIPHPNGISAILFDTTGTKIITACTDGICRVWNSRSGQCVNVFHGSQGAIFDMAISNDNKWFIAASEDGYVRSYALSSPDESSTS